MTSVVRTTALMPCSLIESKITTAMTNHRSLKTLRYMLPVYE